MRLAFEQGELVKGHTYPSPPVGAVILDRDGEAVGVGATEPTGEPPRWSRWAAPASWRSAAPPSSRSSRGNHVGTPPPTTRMTPRPCPPTERKAAVDGVAGSAGSGARAVSAS